MMLVLRIIAVVLCLGVAIQRRHRPADAAGFVGMALAVSGPVALSLVGTILMAASLLLSLVDWIERRKA